MRFRARDMAAERGKRQVSPVWMLDDLGMLWSGGIVVYCLAIPLIGMSAPAYANFLAVAAANHSVGLYLTLFIASLAVMTGYFEHHDRWVLYFGALGTVLHVVGQACSSACCTLLLGWFQGTVLSSEITILDIAGYLLPLVGNCLLLFAFQRNRAIRNQLGRFRRNLG